MCRIEFLLELVTYLPTGKGLLLFRGVVELQWIIHVDNKDRGALRRHIQYHGVDSERQ
jgi:hypothetical protein